MSDLTPSQERAVRLAMTCASLTREKTKLLFEVKRLERDLERAMHELNLLGVTLEREAAVDEDHEERSA